MAISAVYINENNAKLYDVLKSFEKSETNPEFWLFDKVEVDTTDVSEVDGVMCSCLVDGVLKPVIGIYMIPDQGTKVKCYNNGNGTYDNEVVTNISFSTTAAQYTNKGGRLDLAYLTSRGVMFRVKIATYTASGSGSVPVELYSTIAIGKSNDGYPIIVISTPTGAVTTPTTNELTNRVCGVNHLPDLNKLDLTKPAISTEHQAVLVPFMGYGDEVHVFYSPHMFWSPVSNAYQDGFRVIVFEGDSYVSNGYWMIRDEGLLEVSS